MKKKKRSIWRWLALVLVIAVVIAGGLYFYRSQATLAQEPAETPLQTATVRRGETEWQFHPVAARRFVTIRVDVRAEADPLAAVLAAIGSHDVDDAIVRVQVQALPEQAGMLRDVEMRRSLAGAYFVAGINVEIERTYRHRLSGESPEGLSPAELLARYLESKGTPAPRIALLMQYADEILKNVEH